MCYHQVPIVALSISCCFVSNSLVLIFMIPVGGASFLIEKPRKPQMERVSVFDYLSALFYFIVFVFVFALIWSKFQGNANYKKDMAEYNRTVSNYGAQTKKYKDEVINFIRNIDRDYPIDDNGNIPVRVSVKCTESKGSQSIGDELSYYFYVNGKTISSNTEIECNVFYETIFSSKIIEDDPVSDDVGSKKEAVSFGFLDFNDGIVVNHTVKVREQYGRDAGNIAIFDVTYKIQPMTTLTLSSNQRNSFPQYPLLPQEPKEKDYSIGVFDAIQNYYQVQIGIGIAFLATLLVLFIIGANRKKKNNRKMLEYNEALDNYNAHKDELVRNLAGKPLRELAGVPNNVLFTKDNLPYTNGIGKYGDFTFYVTSSGKCFHTDRYCSGAGYPINQIKLSNRYKPCSKCAKGINVQMPDWYYAYLDFKKQISEFEITDYLE